MAPGNFRVCFVVEVRVPEQALDTHSSAIWREIILGLHAPKHSRGEVLPLHEKIPAVNSTPEHPAHRHSHRAVPSPNQGTKRLLPAQVNCRDMGCSSEIRAWSTTLHSKVICSIILLVLWWNLKSPPNPKDFASNTGGLWLGHIQLLISCFLYTKRDKKLCLHLVISQSVFRGTLASPRMPYTCQQPCPGPEQVSRAVLLRGHTAVPSWALAHWRSEKSHGIFTDWSLFMSTWQLVLTKCAFSPKDY